MQLPDVQLTCCCLCMQDALLQQKQAAAGRSWSNPGVPDSPTYRADSTGGSWTLPAGHASTQHSPAHKQTVLASPAGAFVGNPAPGASSVLASTGYSSMGFGSSLGSSGGSSGGMAAAAVAAAQEAVAAARAVEDRLVLAEGRSMAAETAALEAARAAESAGQRVAALSMQLAAAAMQVQEERSQREAATALNQQVCSRCLPVHDEQRLPNSTSSHLS